MAEWSEKMKCINYLVIFSVNLELEKGPYPNGKKYVLFPFQIETFTMLSWKKYSYKRAQRSLTWEIDQRSEWSPFTEDH